MLLIFNIRDAIGTRKRHLKRVNTRDALLATDANAEDSGLDSLPRSDTATVRRMAIWKVPEVDHSKRVQADTDFRGFLTHPLRERPVAA
jgi:hypothetical protein